MVAKQARQAGHWHIIIMMTMVIIRMTMVIIRMVITMGIMRPGQALELVERQVVLFAASEGGQIMVMMAMLAIMPNNGNDGNNGK